MSSDSEGEVDADAPLQTAARGKDEFNMGDIIDVDWKEVEEEQDLGTSKNVDASFVLSSAAVAELLWSKQDAMIDQRRSGHSPIMTEAILFLKARGAQGGAGDVGSRCRRPLGRVAPWRGPGHAQANAVQASDA